MTKIEEIEGRLEVMKVMSAIPDDITQDGNISIGDYYALDIAYLLNVIKDLEQKIEAMEYEAKEEYPE